MPCLVLACHVSSRRVLLCLAMTFLAFTFVFVSSSLALFFFCFAMIALSYLALPPLVLPCRASAFTLVFVSSSLAFFTVIPHYLPLYLTIQARIAQYWPEFAQNGKGDLQV